MLTNGCLIDAELGGKIGLSLDSGFFAIIQRFMQAHIGAIRLGKRVPELLYN